MSRIRTIKPEFWSSGQVMECSRDARLLFIGLWNFCDDQGRFPLSPKQIKALVFPGDEDLTSNAIRGLIDELSANDLLTIYSVGGKEFFEVSGWKHQKIDKPQQPKYPAPPEHSENVRRMVSTEGRGEEGKVSDNTLSPTSDPIADLKQGIVDAYQRAGSQHFPDTHQAEIWLQHGYDPVICLATIKRILARKPNVPVNYFDGAIADAHVKPIGQARAGPHGYSPKRSNIAIAVEKAIQRESDRNRPDPNAGTAPPAGGNRPVVDAEPGSWVAG